MLGHPMTELSTRLSGMRQGVALSALLVFLLQFAQELLDFPERRVTSVLVGALFGVTCIVMGFEELLKRKTLLSVFFSIVGLLCVGGAIYFLPR